jgi:clan AA aspartic protease (TIGR02281 family)
LLALAIPLCAALTPALAADTPQGKPSRAVLVLTLNHALVVADLDGLTAQYQSTDPVVHALAAMAIERLHGNFEQSSKIARMCETNLEASEPFVAHYCARFAAANLRLMGDRQGSSAEEESIAERYKAVLPPSIINNPDITQAPLYKSLAPMTVRVPDGITTVPVKKAPRHGSNVVDVTVDGQPVQMTLDTGAFTALGEETARKLGVKVLLEKDGSVRGVLGGTADKKLGFIDKLMIGDIEVDNVPVSILPDERNLIGTDVLQRLGTFEIQRDALLAYGPSASTPHCETPLLIGTTFWGSPPKLIQRIPIDGVPQNVAFDSGSAFYLTTNQAYTQGPLEHGGQLRIRDANHGSQPVRYAEVTSKVEMAGKSYQLTYAAIENVELPYKYILGAGSLQDVRLFVDFRKQVSCLLPRF